MQKHERVSLPLDSHDFAVKRKQIIAGQRFPTNEEIFRGLPPAKGSLSLDISITFTSLVHSNDVGRLIPNELADRVRRLSDDDQDHLLADICDDLIGHLTGEFGMTPPSEIAEGVLRIAWAGAACGAYTCFLYFMGHLALSESPWDKVYAEGISARATEIFRVHKHFGDNRFSSDRHDDWNERVFRGGLASIENLASIVCPAPMSQEQTKTARKPRISDLPRSNAEPPAVDGLDVDETRPLAITVIGSLSRPSSGREGQEFLAPYRALAGKSIPLVVATDVVAAHTDLMARYPHCEEQIRRITEFVVADRPIRLRSKPILLVGAPGTGKTTLAHAVGHVLGLATVAYDAASAFDSSFAGTSAQWASRRVSVPLQHVVASRQANPLVILDEIGRGGGSRSNGSFLDAILPFLNPETASSINDIGLETSVDLSHVNYIATTNDFEALSPALRDRFHIVKIPEPDPKFLHVYTRHILDAMADHAHVDRKFFPSFDGDELGVMADAWSDRSMRRLEDIVGVMLRQRDTHHAN